MDKVMMHTPLHFISPLPLSLSTVITIVCVVIFLGHWAKSTRINMYKYNFTYAKAYGLYML